MYNRVIRVAYDANILEGPSRFGNWVILWPILGGLVVVYLVNRFAPEAKGHGVPEVMDAIFYQRGDIRSVVAVTKSLAAGALAVLADVATVAEGPPRRVDERSPLPKTLPEGFIDLVPGRALMITKKSWGSVSATALDP
jgi:hypothetical protein